jgi:predicted alpha/beta-fold hydrolase
MLHLNNNGYRAICLNARGTGDTKLQSSTTFNAAKTDDCREAFRHLQIKYPHAPMFALGYSIGANILTKYLAEEGILSNEKGKISIRC